VRHRIELYSIKKEAELGILWVWHLIISLPEKVFVIPLKKHDGSVVFFAITLIFFPQTPCLPVRVGSTEDRNTVGTTLVCYHTRLAGCTCCACFTENMMMMYQQFPQIWYMRQVSVILVRWSANLALSLVIRARSVSVYLCMCVSVCCFALFSITKLTAVYNLYPLNRQSLPPW